MMDDEVVNSNARYWMFRFVTDTPDTLQNYSEDVSMELAKIVRDTERVLYFVRAAEWLQYGYINEERFLEITRDLRAK